MRDAMPTLPPPLLCAACAEELISMQRLVTNKTAYVACEPCGHQYTEPA